MHNNTGANISAPALPADIIDSIPLDVHLLAHSAQFCTSLDYWHNPRTRNPEHATRTEEMQTDKSTKAARLGFSV